MDDAQREDLEYLMLRVDGDIPEFLWQLPPSELSQIRGFVQQVFEHETAGLGKMLEGGLKMLKFFPKGLIKTIAVKHVEPYYVEYTAGELPLKKELDLAKVGYPFDYVAEGLRYTSDNTLCARKIMVQTPQSAEQVIPYLCDRYPMKSLDIAARLEGRFLQTFATHFNFEHAGHPLMTAARQATLEKLKSLDAETI